MPDRCQHAKASGAKHTELDDAPPSTKDSSVHCIASSIPGRLRLRHTLLRDPARLARLGEDIGRWPQVSEVNANARTGSLLVRYDAAALREAECARRCAEAVAGLLPAPLADAESPAPTATAARASRRAGTSRVRANRLAKGGMLASLAASMVLAAMGAKRLHIWTGVFFLHALGVHLWVHRRNLLR